MRWQAVYGDASSLMQYNEDGSENLFKDIDQSRLVMFIVGGKNLCGDDWFWTVNLDNGDFNINGRHVSWDGFGVGVDYRLIYFRRVTQTMGPGTNTQKVVQHLGWQTTFGDKGHPIGEKNHKRIMQITESGRVSIQTK